MPNYGKKAKVKTHKRKKKNGASVVKSHSRKTKGKSASKKSALSKSARKRLTASHKETMQMKGTPDVENIHDSINDKGSQEGVFNPRKKSKAKRGKLKTSTAQRKKDGKKSKKYGKAGTSKKSKRKAMRKRAVSKRK